MTMTTSKRIGARIRQRRLFLGLTQRQLTSGLTKVTAAYISRIEAGERNPSLGTLIQLGKKLDVTALWLLYGSDKLRCPMCGRPHS